MAASNVISHQVCVTLVGKQRLVKAMQASPPGRRTRCVSSKSSSGLMADVMCHSSRAIHHTLAVV